MTIISAYIDDGVYLISDGRISGANNPVHSNNFKLRIIRVEYRYALISRGKFDGFCTFKSPDIALGYAGYATSCNAIISRFETALQRQLFLDRDYDNGGAPKIYLKNDEGKGLKSRFYDDSYNFDSHELNGVNSYSLLEALIDITKIVCFDFIKQQSNPPDVNFVLAAKDGKGEGNAWRGFIINCGDFIKGTFLPNVTYREIQKESLELLGDKTRVDELSAKIMSDPDYAYIATPKRGTTRPLDRHFDDLDMKNDTRRHRIRAIERHTMSMIALGKGTIGGHCCILETHNDNLRIRSIPEEDLAEVVSGIEM